MPLGGCAGFAGTAVLNGPDFELKLKVKACSFGSNHFFTESLILAQDERWRRA